MSNDKSDIGMGVGIDAEMAWESSRAIDDDLAKRRTANTVEPAPKPSTNRPAWELVIEYVEAVFPVEHPLTQLVLSDMRERDTIGRARYGVPLAANNGRNFLVDAYQESLDYAVYLMGFLDEKRALEPNPALTRQIEQIAALFANHMAYLPLLREIIAIEADHGG
jgi:hypothetical protein